MTDDAEPEVDMLDWEQSIARRRHRLRWAMFGMACVVLALLGLISARVWKLENAELDRQSEPTTLRTWLTQPNSTRSSARLGEVMLRGGQSSIMEVCASEGLHEALWLDSLEFVVMHVENNELMVRVPLDAAHLARVRRNSEGGCLLLGSGPIEDTGTYSVDAVWPKQQPTAAVLDTPLQVRVSARLALTSRDRLAVLLLGLSALALLALAILAAPSGSDNDISVGSALPMRVAFAALALGALYGLSELPIAGSTATIAKGSLLFAVQVLLAFVLTRMFAKGSVSRTLGLVAPMRISVALGSAFLAWPLLVITARLSVRWVPSTGEAPIQSFISWPSGMLAAALLGVLLPAAEELFFRGYLYAALLPMGRMAAAVLSVAVFGLMHAQQSWGNWGGLAAVFAAGAVLCAVRVVSGSTLVSALSHVAYNLTLSLASIAASVAS